MEKIYSTADAAKMFNITNNSIKSWIKRENIDCLKTNGGHYKLTEKNMKELTLVILKKYNLQYLVKELEKN